MRGAGKWLTKDSDPARSIRWSLPLVVSAKSMFMVITAGERDECSFKVVHAVARAAWPLSSSAFNSSRECTGVRNESDPTR